jgi:hypothetical protein
MTSDARHNALLAAGIVSGTMLLIGFLTTIINTATAGEAAGALGSVLGGGIGAVGAALAVALTLRGERTEERRKQQEREIQQINAVIAGIAFNLEVLLHLAHDYLLPHREQSYAVYKAYHEAAGDADRAKQLVASLSNYPALNTKCPEISFFECDFWKELPFIVEKDPEILKQSGWLISFAKEIRNHIAQRNGIIDDTISLLQQESGLPFPVFGSMVQRHASIGNAECVTALQLFKKLLDMAKSLQSLDDKAKKVTPPPPLHGVITKLEEIADTLNARQPGPPGFP